MSRFSLLRHLLASTGGGGGITLTYDSRFGTATDANGWFTFGLRGGCRRIWLNGGRPDDSGDGLTAATAKKTFDAAHTLLLNGSFTPGDQLMIAGGYSYTDSGTTGNMTNYGGYSNAYPTAVLSYDPADPTNTAKYGRLTGANMPVVTNGDSLAMTGATGVGYFAIQGIEINGQNQSVSDIPFDYARNGLVFQNCRFNTCRLTLDASASGGTNSIAANISKCSFWGQWRSDNGNSSGLFASHVDGLWVQDCVFIHGGWKIGAARDDATTSGGTSVFGHNIYYGATNINGRFDRVISIDSANNGFGLRGDTDATCLVSIGDAAALVIGSYSTTQTEQPSGVTNHIDDVLIIGTCDINSSHQTMIGIGMVSCTGDSYVQNAAMFDATVPSRGLVLNPTHVFGSEDMLFNTALAMNKVRSYNYASTYLEQFYYGPTNDPTKMVITWHDTTADTLAYNDVGGGTGTLSGATLGTWSGVPAGYQAQDQIITSALTNSGLTPAATATLRKGQLVNAIAWRPDLAGQFAAALQTIGLPTLGLTPTQTPSTSFPNVSSDTPAAIY